MRNSDYKKLLLRLSSFIPVLVIVVMVNYFADPAHVFDNGAYEKKLAEYLANGQNVANVSDYNERLFQKFHVEKIENRPDVLVIGSSRAMQISSGMFPGFTFFNTGVSNAVIQDYLSIFELYQERGFEPRVLIIGIDPWILNGNNSITRWRELEPEYFKMLERLTGKADVPWFRRSIIEQRYFMLLSPKYFQRSLRVLFKPSEKIKYYPVDSMDAEVPIKLSDGSYIYERSFRMKTPNEVHTLALRSIDDYRLANFKELNPGLRNTFELFVKYIKEQNICVIFFLAPYHPVAYKQMIESHDYKIITDVENWVRKVAEENNIKIIGSYNPATCGLKEEDFYDWAHPKRESVEELFRIDLILYDRLISRECFKSNQGQ
jgi:hypothetical protein